MANYSDHLFLKHISKDIRYNNFTLEQLLIVRDRMFNDPGSSKFDRALVQYHIMRLDGRLPSLV